jgi:hypothetical protein
VLLVSNSKLDVKNDAGEVLIDKAGYGSDIEPGLSETKEAGGPGRPYKWPPSKVAEALSSTSFNVALGPAQAVPAAVAAAAVAAAPPPSPRSHNLHGAEILGCGS